MQPKHLVLASSSPRRREILAALGVPFDVIVTDIDEEPTLGEEPEALARRLAITKAGVAAQRAPGRVAVGADTVVALGSAMLGKPASPTEAIGMLRRLRGAEHRVITAVSACQATPSGMEWATEADVTRVWMRNYTDDEIDAYVETGDPLDKAGAYAIQHVGFHPVARVEGCYLTVVGLSPRALFDVLAQVDASLTSREPTVRALCPRCTCTPAQIPAAEGNRLP